jgi:NADH dehydrogenase
MEKPTTLSLSNWDTDIKKIVIAGGGFAGLHLVNRIWRNKAYSITLVDRNNYNYYPPLLYQVSTGFLAPSSISYPFRKMFRNKHLAFRMANVLRVDPEARVLYLDNGELTYDLLVFATGCRTNFFGNENFRKYSIPMKTIDDALLMRNALYKNLELAVISKDPAEIRKLLTIVVAGGGPTGVEVSGMLTEIRRFILSKEYPQFNESSGDIYIIEGGPSLLGAMSEKSHAHAYKALEKLGVKIMLNTQILDYTNDEVRLANGRIIGAKTLIWAAGVTAHTFDGIPQSCIGPGRRMITDEYNKVIGLDNIYAIGDSSIQFTSEFYPRGHPQMAEVAIQQGNMLARNLNAMTRDKPLKKFRYFDEGEMAVIGRTNAVADLFKHRLHFRGVIALVMWLGVHLLTLVNFANIFSTLITWIVAYISRDQSLRMIFRPETVRAEDNPLNTQKT